MTVRFMLLFPHKHVLHERLKINEHVELLEMIIDTYFSQSFFASLWSFILLRMFLFLSLWLLLFIVFHFSVVLCLFEVVCAF